MMPIGIPNIRLCNGESLDFCFGCGAFILIVGVANLGISSNRLPQTASLLLDHLCLIDRPQAFFLLPWRFPRWRMSSRGLLVLPVASCWTLAEVPAIPA